MIAYLWIYTSWIIDSGVGELKNPSNLNEKRTPWEIPSISHSFPIQEQAKSKRLPFS